MICYHGLPITPDKACRAAIENGFAFVSHQYPEQMWIAVEHAKGIGVDNGAFTAWKSGQTVQNWEPYYRWIDDLSRVPKFNFSVIPDVIDGTEKANDEMIEQWPWRDRRSVIGAPVWHLHESIKRLMRLVEEWPRICLGSSGVYAEIGTRLWWNRMAEAMLVICDSDGRPRCNIHSLRMQDHRIRRRFPFASTDSTDIAQNIGIDSKWTGTYQPATKVGRALVLRDRAESHKCPIVWHPSHRSVQEGLFADSAEEEAA